MKCIGQYIAKLIRSVMTDKDTEKCKYCGIIRVCGGSMFVVFLGRPHPLIYILNEN